jgi:hypothetical protein
VRGIPALLYAKSAGRRNAVAAGLLQATSLPFIVTATEIGILLHQLTPVNGAALVGAALLSVVLFPPLALSILRQAPGPNVDDAHPKPDVGRMRPSR